MKRVVGGNECARGDWSYSPRSRCLAASPKTSWRCNENVYQLDIDARGDLGISDAARSMQRRAASSLSKGYTHYIIADSDSETGTEVIGHTPAMSRTVMRREVHVAIGNIDGLPPDL